MPNRREPFTIGSSARRKGVQPSDMGQSLLQVDGYGGTINRVSATETAIPQRRSIMKLQYQTYWFNATRPGQPPSREARAQADAHLRWIDRFYSEVYAALRGHARSGPGSQRDRRRRLLQLSGQQSRDPRRRRRRPGAVALLPGQLPRERSQPGGGQEALGPGEHLSPRSIDSSVVRACPWEGTAMRFAGETIAATDALESQRE